MNCRIPVPALVTLIFSGFFFAAFAQKNPPVLSASADTSVPAAVAAPKKEAAEKWEQELLRDPFWPVGFFPPDWKKATTAEGGADMEGSGWKAASAKLQVSGTSRLRDRTAAIINGELKIAGDQINVLYEGKVYQWQIIEIDSDGQIQLKKLGIR